MRRRRINRRMNEAFIDELRGRGEGSNSTKALAILKKCIASGGDELDITKECREDKSLLDSLDTILRSLDVFREQNFVKDPRLGPYTLTEYFSKDETECIMISEYRDATTISYAVEEFEDY